MIEKYNYEGDPNIGFAATVTKEYALYPPEFKRTEFFQDKKECETFLLRTRLPGLFSAGNSNCVIVPADITDHEKKKLEESDIEFYLLESRNNALGNMILANDKGAYISPRIGDKKEEIEEALGVPVVVGEVASLPNPGSAGVTNNNGALLHREATEEEAEKVQKALGVDEIDIGTINLGSPYVGSGIVCDDENALVGEETSGPEIGRIDRTLRTRE